jgi:hypothetical protein
MSVRFRDAVICCTNDRRAPGAAAYLRRERRRAAIRDSVRAGDPAIAAFELTLHFGAAE